MTMRRLLRLLKALDFEVSSDYRFGTTDAPGNSYHRIPFSQDYVDETGRLVHAEWDGAFWQLQDANTGEFLGLHDERQLPDAETFRPPDDAAPKDIHHNDQLEAALRERLGL